MRPELETALTLASGLPTHQLPQFLGDLEQIRVTAMMRFSTHPTTERKDELLNITEASRRLSLSTNFLYHNSNKFAFTRRVGRRLLFSSDGINEFIRARRR